MTGTLLFTRVDIELLKMCMYRKHISFPINFKGMPFYSFIDITKNDQVNPTWIRSSLYDYYFTC